LTLSEGDILYGGDRRARRSIWRGAPVPAGQGAACAARLRSRSALPSQISNLIADEAIGRMLSALLRSVADTIVDVSDDQIRPVELALPEFIAATLLDKAPVKELGARRRARGDPRTRVPVDRDAPVRSQPVDPPDRRRTSHLAALSSEAVRERGRKLQPVREVPPPERCRLDLGSPLHAQRSISEILYQWGFNDSASFSRVPRTLRDEPARISQGRRCRRDMGEVPRRGRPSAQKEGRPEEREDSAARHSAKIRRSRPMAWSRTCRSMPRAACATMCCRSGPTRSTGAISASTSSPRSKSARATM
jgi:AraC-like DNA-binding protein